MSVETWELKQVKELGRPEVLFSVARAPESSRLFVGTSDANIYEFQLDAEEGEPRQLAGHESYVSGLALARDFLVSASFDGQIIWWNPETGEQVRTVDAHRRWIRGLQASPDGRRVASVADDMVCRLWDGESGTLLHELQGHEPKTPHHFPSMLYACAFSPDGQLLATGDRVGHVVVWELESGTPLTTLEAPEMYTWDPRARIHSIGGIRSLAFSPDSKRLAVGGMGRVGNIDHLEGKARVEIFDWQAGQQIHELPSDTFKGLVERMAFHPEGAWLLAAGGDHGGFLQLIDLESGEVVKQEKAPMHIHDLALNEAGDTIYAVGHGKLVVWEVAKSP